MHTLNIFKIIYCHSFHEKYDKKAFSLIGNMQPRETFQQDMSSSVFQICENVTTGGIPKNRI